MKVKAEIMSVKEKELIIKTNSIFKSVTYDKDSDSWYFVFTDKIAFNVSTLWRLLENRQIKLVSLDNGQEFGLSEPIDLILALTEKLNGKSLLEIKIKQETADLNLILTDNIEIEIFISSSGYESYNFSVDRKNYIGMGGGEIAEFEYK